MKFFNLSKENISKVICVLAIATVVFLVISIFTENNDSRNQVTTSSSTEESLCSILSDIKGVGTVDAMIQYDDQSQVSGVIITASGATDPIVKKNIINGVATVFNISTSDIVVYEKK